MELSEYDEISKYVLFGIIPQSQTTRTQKFNFKRKCSKFFFQNAVLFHKSRNDKAQQVVRRDEIN